MKDNANILKNFLETDQELGYFALVKLEWNATRYITSLPHAVTWNGNEYTSDPLIMQFDSPRYTEVVDREAYTLTINGMDESIKNEINTGILHRPVSIFLGFTINGVPQLGLNDLLHVYTGTVANPKYVVDDDQMLFEIECSAPLSNLDAVSTLYTTKDAMRQIDPTDTCFDKILENNTPSSVAWGKV